MSVNEFWLDKANHSYSHEVTLYCSLITLVLVQTHIFSNCSIYFYSQVTVILLELIFVLLYYTAQLHFITALIYSNACLLTVA